MATGRSRAAAPYVNGKCSGCLQSRNTHSAVQLIAPACGIYIHEPGKLVILLQHSLIVDALSQGYTDLQSLVRCLDHRGIVLDTVCSHKQRLCQAARCTEMHWNASQRLFLQSCKHAEAENWSETIAAAFNVHTACILVNNTVPTVIRGHPTYYMFSHHNFSRAKQTRLHRQSTS